MKQLHNVLFSMFNSKMLFAPWVLHQLWPMPSWWRKSHSWSGPAALARQRTRVWGFLFPFHRKETWRKYFTYVCHRHLVGGLWPYCSVSMPIWLCIKTFTTLRPLAIGNNILSSVGSYISGKYQWYSQFFWKVAIDLQALTSCYLPIG